MFLFLILLFVIFSKRRYLIWNPTPEEIAKIHKTIPYKDNIIFVPNPEYIDKIPRTTTPEGDYFDGKDFIINFEIILNKKWIDLYSKSIINITQIINNEITGYYYYILEDKYIEQPLSGTYKVSNYTDLEGVIHSLLLVKFTVKCDDKKIHSIFGYEIIPGNIGTWSGHFNIQYGRVNSINTKLFRKYPNEIKEIKEVYFMEYNE